MSKADEWYDEYSTTKRFSTQNTDERNKRYQRKSDEWYDKYSTTRRFESSIQYADDEEEKKENKPVIQPDTSVQPQQQTNTQTQTQTQTQIQAPTQNQFQPNTQMQKPSQTQVQDSSAVKNYLNGYTPTVTVQNQINGMTGYNKEAKKFDNESYKSIAKNTFDNMLKQGALTNKDYVYLTEYFGMPQDKVEIPQIKQVYSYDPKKADVKVTAPKDGGDTINSQYIYRTPNMSRNSTDEELFKQYLNDYQKQVESINRSTQDDSIKDSYLEEARLQYEINLLTQREKIEKSSNKDVSQNDNSLFVTPSAIRNRELTLPTSQDKTKTKTQTLLEEKKKRLSEIETQNKLNKILENEEVRSLVGVLHDDEIDKETTALNSLLNPSYAESKSWSTAINSAMGNETTASKGYNARQKLIEMGYNPDELLEQYSRNESRVLTEGLTKKAVEFGEEHPVLGTVLSFPAMFASGAGMIETAKATLTGRDVDPNSPYFAALNVAQGLRGGASSELSSGGEFAYMIGTTIGDMVVTKLGSFGSDFGYAAIMASQAAASTAQEGAQKGYSTEHILINSLTSAALTAVCEKIGYDKVFSAQKATSSKELFGNILRGFLAEGLEEASEETLNTLTTNITSLVFNGETETLARVKELMARGMSREDAEAQAIFEIVGRVGQSYIAGGFSGGILSGVTSSKNYVANRISNLLSKKQTNDAEAPAVNTENEQKTPLNSSVVANDETVDVPKQNAVTEQNTGYANEFDNLYNEDVSEEIEQPAEEVDTTVGEDDVNTFDTTDKKKIKSISAKLKADYDNEAKADLTEKTEPYSSGNAAVDAMLNPNGRLDRKITIDEQAEQKLVDTAKRLFNRTVRFVDNVTGGNGYFDRDTGEIVLSRNSDKQHVTVFGHEFMHTLEGTQDYYDLVKHLKDNSDYIKAELSKVDGNWNQLLQNKITQHEIALGKKLTEGQAESEIFADAIADEFFSDYDALENLATNNQSLFTKLKQWFYRTFFGGASDKRYGATAAARKTYALMLRAEKVARNIAKSGENNGDFAFSAKNPEAIEKLTSDFGYSQTSANNLYKAVSNLLESAGSTADTGELSYAIATALDKARRSEINNSDIESIARLITQDSKGEAYQSLYNEVKRVLDTDYRDGKTAMNKLKILCEKYGELKNGVPQSTDGKSRVQSVIASVMGTKAVQSDNKLKTQYAKDIADGKYDYEVFRMGDAAKKFINSIKYADDVPAKVEEEYRRLKKKMIDDDYKSKDILEAAALTHLLKNYLSEDDFIEYVSLVADVGTASGQIVSALRYIRDFTPSQRLKAVLKWVDNYNNRMFGENIENPEFDENGGITDGSDPTKHKLGTVAKQQAKRREKYTKLEIPKSLQENLENAKTQAEVDKAMLEINQYVTRNIRRSWWDKVNSFRYLMMLLNLKTAIRNTIGNVAGYASARAKDVVASGLYGAKAAQSHGKGNIRTVSVRSDKSAKKAAFDLLSNDDSVQLLMSGQNKQTGKVNPFLSEPAKTSSAMKKVGEKVPVLGLILENREVQNSPYKSKFMKKLVAAESKLLDDTPFKILRARSVLAQSIYINQKNGNIKNIDDFVAVALGEDTPNLDKTTRIKYAKLYDEFAKVAAREADEATFREENELINKFNKFRQGDKLSNRVVDVLIDGIVPFVKTPANVTKRAVEYSPLGLLKNITYDIYKLSEGSVTRNQYINNLAKGLTGTAVFGIGALLGGLGLIDAGDSDEEDEAERKLLGGQEYSIRTKDGSYTLDWLTPASISLFMGAKMLDIIKSRAEEEKGGMPLTWDETISLTSILVDSISSISEPMFNQTMLDGIDGALERIGTESVFSKESLSAAGILVAYSAENWALQFMPSALGAIARTADDTVRTYYNEPGKEESLLGDLLVGVKKKIPGATNTTPAKLDMWGQPMSTGTLTERLIENFISPGYYEKDTKDKATLALHEFADDNDIPYTDIIPKDIPKFYDFRGKTYNLTAEEYELYAGIIGKARKEAVEKALVDGEDIEVSYRLYDIKSANDSGITFKDVVFEGNLADAENIKGWAPSGESEGYFEYEYSDEDNKKKATSKTAVSDELFRKMLFDEYMKEVTEKAAFEARKQIAENRKNEKE